MSSAVVTGAGFRIVKDLGGRKYTLAALSYGEAGRMSEASAVSMRPPQAVILEEVREALKRLDKADLVQKVDAFEEAEVHFQATMLAHGGSDKEGRAEIAEARERLLRAQIGYRSAEWLTREDPALKDLRSLDGRLGREEHVAMLVASLRGWEGEGLPAFPGDKLDAEFITTHLPAGDVAALGIAALALMSPTKEAVGN
jgi:hypothetical protein